MARNLILADNETRVGRNRQQQRKLSTVGAGGALQKLGTYSATTISRTGRPSVCRRPFSSLRRSVRICLASESGKQSENFRVWLRRDVILGQSSDARRVRRTS